MWYDGIRHIRRDCADFAEALTNNVVYLSNDCVHTSDTRRLLKVNTGRGGMKGLMEEINSSVSARIRVGEERGVGFGSDYEF